jgi:ubiquinone biosynthesis protein UbiJ
MKTLLITTLENTLNAYLRSDPQSASRLAKLAGKTIRIELLPMHLIFNAHFTHERVSLSTHSDEEPLTKIKGTPLQMFGALLAKENRHQFFADDLVIEGDAEFAQSVTSLFDNVSIDWENYASQYIGDVPAYKLGKIVNSMKDWVRKTQRGFSEDINDYLHEEATWFPHKEALKDFFTDIDNLRMDADRLEARLNHLKSKLEKEDTQ